MFLVPFDSLHLGSEHHRGSLGLTVLIQHLQDTSTGVSVQKTFKESTRTGRPSETWIGAASAACIRDIVLNTNLLLLIYILSLFLFYPFPVLMINLSMSEKLVPSWPINRIWDVASTEPIPQLITPPQQETKTL